MRNITRWGLFALILALFAPSLQAQIVPNFTRTHTFGANTNSPCYDVGTAGISYHQLRVFVSSVSAGTVKLIGSSASDCSSSSDIIAAFDITTNRTTNVYAATYRYIRLVPASFAGAGLATVRYEGWSVDPSSAYTYCNDLSLTVGDKGDLCVDQYGQLKTRAQLRYSQSVTTTMQNAVTANGNGTVIAVDGQAAVVATAICSVSCSGGTQIIFEAQNDGTNFVAVNALQAGSTTVATTYTLSGTSAVAFKVQVSGYKELRARVLNYSAGTLTVIGTTVPIDASPLVFKMSDQIQLADNLSLPVSAIVGAVNLCYDGTNADLCRAAATASNGTDSAGTNIMAIALLAQCDDTSPVTVSENQFGNVRMSCARHALRIEGVSGGDPVPISASAAIPISAAVGAPAFVTQTPSATGGWSTFNATSGDGSTACTNSSQAVKGSAGTFGGYEIFNPNTSTAYVILYNTASGSVTVGTTTPLKVIPIPAGALANYEMANGAQFGTAIAVACTSTAAGNGAPSTALDVNLNYK